MDDLHRTVALRKNGFDISVFDVGAPVEIDHLELVQATLGHERSDGRSNAFLLVFIVDIVRRQEADEARPSGCPSSVSSAALVLPELCALLYKDWLHPRH